MNTTIIGFSLALLSAFSFGTNNIVVRIGTLRYPPKITVPSTLLTGLMVILAAYLVGGNIGNPPFPNNRSLICYILAGALSFGLARYAFYLSVLKVGATATGVMISGNVIITGVLGVIFLHEPSTAAVWLGLLLFVLAVIIASGHNASRISVGKATDISYGLLASLIVALANIIIRAGNVSGGDPIAGLGISYLTGLLIYLILTPRNFLKGAKLVLGRNRIVILMGVIVTMGQLFRYVAFKYLPAVLATPVISSSMFFTIGMIGFVKQAKEKPGPRQALGVILGFAAIALMYLK